MLRKTFICVAGLVAGVSAGSISDGATTNSDGDSIVSAGLAPSEVGLGNSSVTDAIGGVLPSTASSEADPLFSDSEDKSLAQELLEGSQRGNIKESGTCASEGRIGTQAGRKQEGPS